MGGPDAREAWEAREAQEARKAREAREAQEAHGGQTKRRPNGHPLDEPRSFSNQYHSGFALNGKRPVLSIDRCHTCAFELREAAKNR